MKAVLFDLDDTLYPESEFIRSGMRSVARHLASRKFGNEHELESRMLEILERDGRGRVFDTLLEERGVESPDLVSMLLLVYRTHEPAIQLYGDVLPAFRRLRTMRIRLGLITDGMGSVQRRKIAALGLESWLEAIVCTDELGPGHEKPSPLPYRLALDLLEVKARDCMYVGNDPKKDFAGARSISLMTVCINRQPDKGGTPLGPSEGADTIIGTLDEIATLVEARP